MDGLLGPDLADLVGRPLEEVRDRLGPPDVEREAGGDRWLVYERRELGLRMRFRPAAARPADGFRLASWTASLREPRTTLREAAETLGLWPACAPDADPRSAEAPLLRREVRVGGAPGPLTLTARVRGGRVDQITLFDEEPEWDRSGP